MAKTINLLKYKLSALLGQARVERNGSLRIYDYKKYLHKSNLKPKKALVSYLVNPVIDELSGAQTSLFSNNGAGRSIPKVLNELGYKVDVINWDDVRPITGVYDLVVFHGPTSCHCHAPPNFKVNYNKSLRLLTPTTT